MDPNEPLSEDEPVLSLVCPKCGAYMEKIEFAGVEVDRCTNCVGLWFDYREAEFLRSVPGANDLLDIGDPQVGVMLDVVQHIRCPRCDVPMDCMIFDQQPHLRFECCPHCYGIYFDAGEFHEFAQGTIIERIVRIWLTVHT